MLTYLRWVERLNMRAGTFGTSIPGPALPRIMADIKVTHLCAVLRISLYTEGLAVGPLLLAPVSEIHGHRWVYIGASTCFVAFAAGAGASPNFGSYLVCRFLGGCPGSASIAIGGGSIADLWPVGPARQVTLLLFVLASFLSPCLSPFIGAYTVRAYHGDWRWTQWLLCLMGTVIWALILLMQETGRTRERLPRARTTVCSMERPLKMLSSDIITLLLTIHTSLLC